jgi:acetylornithine deacetylase/succinyl-diaminopimelate desuccinylase-like protein
VRQDATPAATGTSLTRALRFNRFASAQAIAHSRAARKRFVRELAEFIRFPSVSTQHWHAEDMQRCAAWLADHLQTSGLEHVRVVRTPRHPIVTADWLHAPHAITALIYGHYDVQPAEPLNQWQSPPFEPTVRGEYLYGRGASDDKGQMFVHIKAIESYLKTAGGLPVNVICLFEGEEEIGSPSLRSFLTAQSPILTADCAVVSDMQIPASDCPAITYALRGALSLELEVQGSQRELHSGVFGGAIHSPLQVLCEMIARLHDAQGRVCIPGFYHHVRRWDAGERAYMRQMGPSDAQLLRSAGAPAWGERGYTFYERTTIRPALTVTGIAGGYRGQGGKAAIPTSAVAKFDFRLVPDQDPQEIDRLIREHIVRLTPRTMHARVSTQMSARPALIDRSHPVLGAAARAYHGAFGAQTVFLRNGGTIPVVNLIQEILGIPAVLMGFGLPDDRIHGPNEKFHLPNFFRGIATSCLFLAELSGWRGESRIQPRKSTPHASRDGLRRA